MQVDSRSARLASAMKQLRTQHVAVQLPALEQGGEASALEASVLLNPLSKVGRCSMCGSLVLDRPDTNVRQANALSRRTWRWQSRQCPDVRIGQITSGLTADGPEAGAGA